MVGTDALEKLLIETASEGPTALTVRAVFLEGTGIARGRIGSILLGPFGVAVLFQTQEGSMWAGIGILFGIILKLPLSIERGPLVKVRQGHIGVDVLVFKRHNVVHGSVGGVPGGLAQPQIPAKTCAEDEIEHRLVFHHFRRGHQHGHDDPCLAAIHHVMGVIAQMASIPFGEHDGSIRIGGADHEVSHASIGSPDDLPVRFSHLLDPVGTLLIGRRPVVSEGIFQGGRQLNGSHDGR